MEMGMELRQCPATIKIVSATNRCEKRSQQCKSSSKEKRKKEQERPKELHPARLPPVSRRPNVQRNAVQRSRSATWTLHPATSMVAVLVVAHPSLACHHARKTHNYKQSPSTPRRVQARPAGRSSGRLVLTSSH